MTVADGTLPAEGVRRMFDRIAPVYDAMNRVMTAGLDQRWRRITIDETVCGGDRVLDACCGTGDLAIAARARGTDVVGLDFSVLKSRPTMEYYLDFSERMLERARKKEPQIEWLEWDVLALPFDDGSFDAVTVGFGVRNVVDLEAGLRGLRRVLRPGGRLGILEITTPRGRLAPFYRVWFDRIVPALGKVLPGGAAYTYLPASVRRFPGPDDLAVLLERTGFAGVRYRLFAGGIVALHVAEADA